MPKLKTLLKEQLIELCRSNDIDTSGTKPQIIERLTEHFETDEIDSSTLNSLQPQSNTTMQAELAAMKDMICTLATSINEMRVPSVTNNNENSANRIQRERRDDTDSQYVLNDTESSVSFRSINNPRHRYSVREITETIPEFDPTKEAALSAEQFVQHVEGSKTVYEWDDKTLLLAIYGKLKGVARMWFDARTSLFTTWNEFKRELISEFGLDLNEAEISAKMSSASRRMNEEVIDYCFRIHSLGKQFNLSENAIIKYARDGLKYRELQQAIAALKFQTMKEFRNTITEFLANMPTTARQFNNFPSSNMSRNNQKLGNHPVKQEYNKTLRPTNVEIVCYNCNGKGHISKNCQFPQRRERCAQCQRTNHKTEDCRMKPPVNTVVRSAINNIAETEEVYNNVVKQIGINGKMTRSFWDSGSTTSLIREKFATKCGTLKPYAKKLTGFAGGSYEVTSCLTTKITIDECEFDVNLMVVSDNDIPENILIGRDLICRDGLRFIIENGECRVEPVNVHMIIEPSNNMAVTKLLERNKHCVANSLAELGKCSVERMKIELTTTIPVNAKPYRLPFAKWEIVREIINELLETRIIRRSQSHYASPVVLVDKKNGEHRLCVDFRAINKITLRVPFPIPNMEEQFTRLAGNLYFSTLDLRSGYHQIEMDEASKQYTAFVTIDGHYEYNRMPFGLKNAPAVFQRIMNKISDEMNTGELLVYLDDVIIPSQTIEEGIKRLEKFLLILTKYGLTLRLDKCKFLETEIEYLGHVVRADGISPGQRKVKAIENYKEPTNVTEVRRFLGLTGFFRKFVPNYSTITRPITHLLKKDIVNFCWADEQKRAFEKLIGLLINAPILVLYDVTKQHEVHTDACAIGLAGVLLQSNDGKDWKPVIYFSRHCSSTEQIYHSYELEVLAVVESLERFRLYLLGKTFRVVTDCEAVAQTKAERELKRRIGRWWLKLQCFDFELIHRPGSNMAHVDAMSRAPVEEARECEEAGFMYTLTDQQSDWVIAMQQRDERAKYITNILTGRLRSHDKNDLKQEYELKDGRLYRKINDMLKFYVPKAVRWQLVKHYHNDMGHSALEKTIDRLGKWFWFPKMRKWVKEYIKACIECCYNKTQRNKPEGELHFSDPVPIPFVTIHIDHLGPFIKSTKGNTHILAITDAFSKFCVVKAVKNTKSGPVINILKEVMSYFGAPKRLISDRGTAFTSKQFKSFCHANGIQHVKTAVRTPRANGQVERYNSTILNMIKTSTTEHKRWDENLETLQWVLNSQRNATTKFTPNDLIFSYPVNDVVHNNLVAAVTTDEDAILDMSANERHEIARDNIIAERLSWKQRFDKKHTKPTNYEEGDLVAIRFEPAATGESRKLEAKYRGPYVIKQVLGNDRYVIVDVPGLQLKAKAFNSVYSSDHLKPWCNGYPELVDNDSNERECDYTDEEADDSSEDAEEIHNNESKMVNVLSPLSRDD